jgi:hypothetical protein
MLSLMMYPLVVRHYRTSGAQDVQQHGIVEGPTILTISCGVADCAFDDISGALFAAGYVRVVSVGGR